MKRGLPVSQHRVGAGPLLGGLPPELRGLRTAAGGGCWQLETAVVLLLLHGGATVAEEGGGELSAVDTDNCNKNYPRQIIIRRRISMTYKIGKYACIYDLKSV